MVQVNDYDAWGLDINSFQQNSKSNFKFQNQERIDDFNLNVDFFKYRISDPAIGRFWQVDPLANKYVHNSIYAFSENKVTGHIELEGLESISSFIYNQALQKNNISSVDARKNERKAATLAATMSDANDATVMVTTFTRKGNAVNLDGSKASMTDKIFAFGGALIPFMAGAVIAKGIDKIKNFVSSEEKMVRLRHYTSNQGMDGIKADMELKAYDQNKVFAEKAKRKPLSAADASSKYGIDKKDARNYIEFDVPESRVEKVKNAVTGNIEYTVKGNVKLDQETTKFFKRN